MNQSLIPTKYLLVKARTGSDWDNCNYILVHLTAEWILDIQHRVTIAKTLKPEKEFDYIAFFESPVGFFIENEEASEIIERIEKQFRDWCFVTVDENEIEGMEIPEAELDYYLLKIDGFGHASYTVSGEYSGEQYFSEFFKVDEILSEILNNAI